MKSILKERRHSMHVVVRWPFDENDPLEPEPGLERYRVVAWQCDSPERVSVAVELGAKELRSFCLPSLSNVRLPSFHPAFLRITEFQRNVGNKESGDIWEPYPGDPRPENQLPPRWIRKDWRVFRPMILYILDPSSEGRRPRHWNFFAALTAGIEQASNYYEMSEVFSRRPPGNNDVVLVRDGTDGFAKNAARLLRGLGFSGSIFAFAKRRKAEDLIAYGCRAVYDLDAYGVKMSGFVRELEVLRRAGQIA